MVALLEAEIRRLRSRITELEREKADVEAFAAMAAHELLAPLVMIDAYAATVSERVDEELDPDSLRDLDALRRGAVRTRLLAETLLHDARCHGRPLRRRPIDVNLVVRECLTLLAPEIRSRGAEVQVAALPEVCGEERLISSLFTNLLTNALRYGPRDRGKILVDATLENASWRFSVQSQGPTIPAADRKRIFEPYHRGRGERRARRQPRVGDLSSHRRAPRRRDRRQGRQRRRQPLLLHAASLSRPSQRPIALRVQEL